MKSTSPFILQVFDPQPMLRHPTEKELTPDHRQLFPIGQWRTSGCGMRLVQVCLVANPVHTVGSNRCIFCPQRKRRREQTQRRPWITKPQNIPSDSESDALSTVPEQSRILKRHGMTARQHRQKIRPKCPDDLPEYKKKKYILMSLLLPVSDCVRCCCYFSTYRYPSAVFFRRRTTRLLMSERCVSVLSQNYQVRPNTYCTT